MRKREKTKYEKSLDEQYEDSLARLIVVVCIVLVVCALIFSK